MKLVFNQQETADALHMSLEEFVQNLPKLYEHGFPEPLPGLGERWSIMTVINWVNRQATLAASRPIERGSRRPELKLVNAD